MSFYRSQRRIALLSLFFLVMSMLAFGADGGARNGKSFIYTLSNPSGPNSVVAYEVSAETGQLTYTGSYATGGLGQATDNIIAVQQSAIAWNGHFLFVVNPGSNDLSVFSVNADGSLDLVRHGIPSGGNGPVSIAIHGNLMYVANIGDDSVIPANYTGFRIDEGRLEPIAGSTVTLNVLDHPATVLFNDDGSLLAGSRGIAGKVDVFQVERSGLLTRTAELPGQPGVLGLAFNPVRKSQLMGALTFLPGAASYAISDSGDISVVNTITDVPSIDSCWEVISKDGSKAWVSAPMSASITLYQIDQQGALTRVSAHGTAGLGAGAADLTFDAHERFLYVLKSFGNKLHAMRLNDSLAEAGVEDVQTVDIPGSQLSAIGLQRVDIAGEDSNGRR
ncbi:MAG TPA: beta-propeller fold lactonase family protein [Candidatus Saccharimonadales bacterium]|nr:beta-propeller fold lactonase family protein [Candidatus Saccharimonadales bacterium]